MKKYKIGAVTKLLNLSEDTLRYYESRGVVAPQKDEESGYRYYDAWDLNFLLDGIWYRSFDFPLKDVVKMINEDDGAAFA
ncbi:MAG: MerR family transcriptional regulator, partial [Clostridiales Family XIII bacterium]|nr:MerR family transcriptional regulator [Clostridiales Family XIII bacterium]